MENQPRTSRETFVACHLFHASLGEDFPLEPQSAQLIELVNREVDPNSYTDVNSFRDDYWRAESFSKTPFEIEGIDRRAAALTAFREAEVRCADANRSLCDLFLNHGCVDILSSITRARGIVASILGPFSWDESLRFGSFGPGASTSLRRAQASHGNKWLSRHVTRDCLDLALAATRFWKLPAPLGKFEIVLGNKVTTVPKNAKVDRVIAIEPDWNMFFQRCIGGAMRYRLRSRIGLLKERAQRDHREMAMFASVTGNLATIDLKAASDSVSLALVEALLPDDWLAAVLKTRSAVGVVDGEVVSYEKVSSMGNGFTFELETLIFYALVRSVCRVGSVSVYGDDIICPAGDAEAVISLLNRCGFQANPKKTHLRGPFRESCGGHYFDGYDVTPPYFRNDLREEIHFNSAANNLTRCSSQRYGFSRDIRFRALHRYLSRFARFRGPELAGDAVVFSSQDEAMTTPYVSWSRTHQAWKVKCLSASLRHERCDHMGGVFASLYGRSVTEDSTFKRRVRYHVGKLTCDSWSGPGDWV